MGILSRVLIFCFVLCVAPIQIEIAECGAATRLVDLVRYDEEDDGTITMAIKVLDSLASEGKKNIYTSPGGVLY